MNDLLIACLVGFLAITSVNAQGTFQNLGFESASPVAIPGDSYQRVQFDSAFPGWVGYVGGGQQSAALSNSYFLDSSGIAIIDTDWPDYFGPPIGVIAGRYTALLQAGVTGVNNTPADTTLSQTGLVPVNAESLRFRTFATPFGSVRVLLGGQQLSLFPLTSGANYTVFGADIHSWQGQVAQLDFTVIAQRPHVVNINIFLDSIEFSTQPIPEPGVIGLSALGALLFAWRWSKKSRR